MWHARGTLVSLALVAPLLAACATDEDRPSLLNGTTSLTGSAGAYLTEGRPPQAAAGPLARADGGLDRRVAYTDLAHADTTGAISDRDARVGVSDDGKTVSLNFVDAEVQEFVRVVFDEVLRESAIVDPGVTGKVTVRTVQPVSKTVAVDLVRNVLQMNGASLTKQGAVFRVARADDGSGRQTRPGEGVRAIPLRFLEAEQARSAVQSLAGNGSQLFASKGGRMLIASGAPADLDAVEQVIASLDVDQMAGMSFALVPLQDAGAPMVSSELTSMFGSNGALKAMPIQRLNAVLLVSRSSSAMERARGWIRRLDQAGHDGRRVFVYAVQNRRAKELAQILNGILGGSGSRGGDRTSEPLAPTIKPAVAVSEPQMANARVDQVFEGVTGSVDERTGATAGSFAEEGGRGAGPLTQGEVAVSADLSTNSLVVIAKPEDYRLVEAAIRRLDVQPAQVLIEVTIFEVQLNDALRHGVRWFFESGNHGAILTDSRNGGMPANYPGFNYVFQIPQAKIVLNALESVTDLEVISSPALTVLDNQTATLKVGDQVPIATRSAQSVENPASPVVNDIQLKDTGLILSVTPRVNASGLVQLDISQEASDVVKTTTSAIDSPTIRQRSVNSSVSVPSGTELVLGGLIQKRRETGRSGLPVLKDIPILGEAFTSNALADRSRTELLILIRPIVMASRADVVSVTQEIKARMMGLVPRSSPPIVK
jgi:general secretion pathway protein D